MPDLLLHKDQRDLPHTVSDKDPADNLSEQAADTSAVHMRTDQPDTAEVQATGTVHHTDTDQPGTAEVQAADIADTADSPEPEEPVPAAGVHTAVQG